MEVEISGLMSLLIICCSVQSIVSLGTVKNTISEEPSKTKVLSSNLYPQASETRDLRDLNGIWNFRLSPNDPQYGYRQGWYKTDLEKTGPVIPMPVPASFNDIGEDASIRDHSGLVWYDRRFYISPWWISEGQRIWLRFGSVHYAAQVWVNGVAVVRHQIGHLPFEVEITDVVKSHEENLLTVAVDNVLYVDTIPQGQPFVNVYYNHTQLKYSFDFFNYAGIHRNVFLYTTPLIFINDIVVNTDIQGLTGFVVYNVSYQGARKGTEPQCLVQLYDKNNTLIISSSECSGLLGVANANFWWPYLMHPEPGYLYTLKVSLIGTDGSILDTYQQKIGIRTITWTNTAVYINEKPIYMRGFGMHEDSDLRGKGWDPVLWTKNFNLIQWVGANTFRTSHYPYADEIYQMADEKGIMIIDECPSVNTEFFSANLLNQHKQSLTELIHRDKNHPSVIMWSIANEPYSDKPEADKYFKQIAEHVRSMDLSRPITIAISRESYNDKTAQHLDVISFNRYEGWYRHAGLLLEISVKVKEEASQWHKKFNKPILMSEYGADTIAGMHMTPEYVFSEEYQVSLMSEHFKAFDALRSKGFFVGEFIWNFADFNTAQGYTRVLGNKKGIFTRQRQPKASAHHLRKRYLELAASEGAVEMSADIAPYTSDYKPSHLEL